MRGHEAGRVREGRRVAPSLVWAIRAAAHS